MTREEAVLILKTFMDNPLFNDAHKSAFNIAIHDIEMYQKWNLNELVLTSKDNEQDSVMDKIRAEIKALISRRGFLSCSISYIRKEIDAVFDKYKVDGEE